MKLLFGLTSVLCSLVFTQGLHAQSSIYSYYFGSDLDAYLSPTGGSGNASFSLSSGSQIAGLGSIYDVQLTFHDSSPSGLWDQTGGGPSGNTGAAFSLTQADATGVVSFGNFQNVPGYDVSWSLVTFNFTSPSPPLTEDTFDYTGSDTPVSGQSSPTWQGTPDAFLYTEGSNNSSTANVGFQVTYTPVPEPSASMMLGLGGLALLLRRKK